MRRDGHRRDVAEMEKARRGEYLAGQATPPAGNDFVAIAAGAYHSLALRAEGSIIGWGYNNYGQALPPAGNDFVAIAAAGDHSLALKADGSIVGWGNNTSGQATPPVGNDFVAIAAGGWHSLALKSDGSIVGWGYNSYGQATPPPGNDFVAIAAGEFHSLALKADGSIVGWGDDSFGLAAPPMGNDFIGIAAGAYHGLAMQTDGSIVGWGDDFFSQATPPAGSGFIAISAGYYYSLALKRVCGYSVAGDLNDDCRVNLMDFSVLSDKWQNPYTLTDLAVLAAHWLTDCFANPTDPACVPKCGYSVAGDLNDDCRVNLMDFSTLSDKWQNPYTLTDLAVLAGHWLTDCFANPADPACVPQ